MNEDTSEGCMKSAFSAILRGDYAERDRLCARARALMEAEHHADAVERVLFVDFYVNSLGVAVSTRAMAKAAGAIQ